MRLTGSTAMAVRIAELEEATSEERASLMAACDRAAAVLRKSTI